MPYGDFLFVLGLILVFVGFIIAFLAVLLLFLKGVPVRGRTRGGGLIMIGPIPIIFGTDKESVKILIILAIVLIAVVVALMLVLNLVV